MQFRSFCPNFYTFNRRKRAQRNFRILASIQRNGRVELRIRRLVRRFVHFLVRLVGMIDFHKFSDIFLLGHRRNDIGHRGGFTHRSHKIGADANKFLWFSRGADGNFPVNSRVPRDSV